MRKLVVAVVLCLCEMGTASAAVGNGSSLDAFDTGFAVRNEAALAQSFALPALGAPHILAPGRDQARLTVDWTNEYVRQTRGADQLIEDGETQAFTLSARRGFAGGPWGGFELGLTLPLRATNGGVLDGIIHNYHDVFGFPDGGRGAAPHGRLLYRYTRDGRDLLDVDQSGFNLDDMRLSAGWQVKPTLALRAMVKMPTGSTDHLTGGNWGGALWLDFDPRLDPDSRWFGFISLGGSWNATSDVLPGLQRHLVGLGGGGIGYHLTQRFSLQAQAYAHTPLYKHTPISALRRMGLQGAFGGRFAFSRHLALTAGFQEDLVTDSSPDFSIHLGLTLR